MIILFFKDYANSPLSIHFFALFWYFSSPLFLPLGNFPFDKMPFFNAFPKRKGFTFFLVLVLFITFKHPFFQKKFIFFHFFEIKGVGFYQTLALSPSFMSFFIYFSLFFSFSPYFKALLDFLTPIFGFYFVIFITFISVNCISLCKDCHLAYWSCKQ